MFSVVVHEGMNPRQYVFIILQSEINKGYILIGVSTTYIFRIARISINPGKSSNCNLKSINCDTILLVSWYLCVQMNRGDSFHWMKTFIHDASLNNYKTKGTVGLIRQLFIDIVI